MDKLLNELKNVLSPEILAFFNFLAILNNTEENAIRGTITYPTNDVVEVIIKSANDTYLDMILYASTDTNSSLPYYFQAIIIYDQSEIEIINTSDYQISDPTELLVELEFFNEFIRTPLTVRSFEKPDNKVVYETLNYNVAGENYEHIIGSKPWFVFTRLRSREIRTFSPLITYD